MNTAMGKSAGIELASSSNVKDLDSGRSRQ
jgi:hypothetical protein